MGAASSAVRETDKQEFETSRRILKQQNTVIFLSPLPEYAYAIYQSCDFNS